MQRPEAGSSSTGSWHLVQHFLLRAVRSTGFGPHATSTHLACGQREPWRVIAVPRFAAIIVSVCTSNLETCCSLTIGGVACGRSDGGFGSTGVSVKRKDPDPEPGQ